MSDPKVDRQSCNVCDWVRTDQLNETALLSRDIVVGQTKVCWRPHPCRGQP